MKNPLALRLLAALSSVPALAASSIGGHAGIGIDNGSRTIASVVVDNGSPAKFLGGIFYELTFTDNLSLFAELDFRTTEVSWLSFPIQLKITFYINSVRPFLVMGPEFAVKIGGDTNPAAQKGSDFLAVAGGGLAFDVIPKVALHILGRYELGFSDVSTINGIALKNRGIHILAGVAYTF